MKNIWEKMENMRKLPMKIETNRLSLYQLNSEEEELWLNHLEKLEQKLAISYQGEAMTGFFREIVKQQINRVSKFPSAHFSDFWLIILRDTRTVIGSADFKTLPNESGEVEIGYGLAASFEGSGYMTEAVRALCDWALSHENVKAVSADTEDGNLKSERVLEKVGFVRTIKEKNQWWKYGN